MSAVSPVGLDITELMAEHGLTRDEAAEVVRRMKGETAKTESQLFSFTFSIFLIKFFGGWNFHWGVQASHPR